MTGSRPISFLASAAVISLVAVIVTGCGSGAATAATPKTSSGASATVGVAKSGLRSIRVESTGRTLYLFKADDSMTSASTGACATAWMPLPATITPTAVWYALTPAGNPISTQPTRSGGGYGY